MKTRTYPADPVKARIRALNDAHRKSFGEIWLLTSGVRALPAPTVQALVTAIRRFDVFTEDNDPHFEHDFGSVTQRGRKVFWKIDYYDRDMRMGSNDPSDPDVTQRVLTVMLVEEY